MPCPYDHFLPPDAVILDPSWYFLYDVMLTNAGTILINIEFDDNYLCEYNERIHFLFLQHDVCTHLFYHKNADISGPNAFFPKLGRILTFNCLVLQD